MIAEVPVKRPQFPFQRLKAFVRLAALALLLMPAAACSSMDNFTLDPLNLFSKKDTVVPDEPADRLYNEALYLLNNKEYKQAARKFEEVDRQHPYSDWARRSLLMAAFSYYETGSYEECIASGRRYVTLYPGTPEAAYAQYLIGSSYYDQIPDISRDQSRSEKAIAAYDEVVRKYPTSEYAETAKRRIEGARDQLAGKEMQVGRYYLEQRNYTGAINRFRVVITTYQTTRHTEEALMRLAEAYMAMGISNEAQTATAVLGHNFPESVWYKDAYKLVKDGGLEPREDKGSWISRAFKKLGVG